MTISKKHPLGIILAIFFSCQNAASSPPANYIDNLVATHPDIFVTTIVSANLCVSKAAAPCFYRYEARVFEFLHGNFSQKDFTFFSEANLMMGGDYLVFFSKKTATYRSAALPIFIDGQREPHSSDCAELMTGNFLTGNEIALLKF